VVWRELPPVCGVHFLSDLRIHLGVGERLCVVALRQQGERCRVEGPSGHRHLVDAKPDRLSTTSTRVCPCRRAGFRTSARRPPKPERRHMSLSACATWSKVTWTLIPRSDRNRVSPPAVREGLRHVELMHVVDSVVWTRACFSSRATAHVSATGAPSAADRCPLRSQRRPRSGRRMGASECNGEGTAG
jgi:hypothetical protein